MPEPQNPGQVNENALFESDPFVENELTQEAITAEIMGEQNPNNPNPNPPAPGTPPPAGDDSFESFVENTIKASNPDYILPESIRTGKKVDGTPLTAREKHELLSQQIIANTAIPGEDDAFVQQYLSAKAKGIDANSFVNQYNSRINMLNMPSAEFVKTMYRSVADAKGERRYTDEDIDKLIEGKSAIEIDQMADGMKRNYAQSQLQKMEADSTAAIEKENKEYQPVVDSFVSQLKNGTSIFGFDLSAEDKEALGTEVSKLFVRSPKDNMNEFERIMSDDNFVLQIAPLILMVKNGKYRAAMTALKEATKAKAIEKLDSAPGNQGGGLGKSNQVDESKLYDMQ